jgi:hypothetical protein
MGITYTYLSTDYCLLVKSSVAHQAFVGEIKCPLPTRCWGLLVKSSVSHRVFVGEIECPLPTRCRALVGENCVICNNKDVTIKYRWHLMGGQALMWQDDDN